MRTPSVLRFLPPSRIPAAGYAAVLLAAVEISVDVDTWIQLNVSIVYGLPLVLAAASGSRRVLWTLAMVLVASTFIVYAQQIPPGQFALNEPFFVNRVLSAVTVFLTAGLLHALTITVEALRAHRDAAVAESGRKSRVLASMSHDLRTPLSTISLIAEFLQHGANDPHLALHITELASQLKRNTVSVSELLSDVLDISSIDAGRVQLHESEFSLRQFLAEEHQQLEPLARAKGLGLTLRNASPELWLNADRIKLARILRNLVTNAIKFTSRGGIDITVERAVDGSALISVADTGIGIRAEDLARIFDDFAHIDGAGHQEHGWGLGLAICRRLAEVMGGAIEVRSQVNAGSVFTLRLPAARILMRRAVRTVPSGLDATPA